MQHKKCHKTATGGEAETFQAKKEVSFMVHRTTLIGLLTEAGLISCENVAKASDLAEDFGRYPGNLLVETFLNNEAGLELALKVMEWVNSGKMSKELACEVLRVSWMQHSTCSEVVSTIPSRGALLGELMSKAGIVNYRVLASAVINAELMSMRLGQSLVLSLSNVRAELVIMALELQAQIRNKQIDFDGAVSKLVSVKNAGAPQAA